MCACSVVSNSATLRTAASQAPLSMGFARQKYCSTLQNPIFRGGRETPFSADYIKTRALPELFPSSGFKVLGFFHKWVFCTYFQKVPAALWRVEGTWSLGSLGDGRWGVLHSQCSEATRRACWGRCPPSTEPRAQSRPRARQRAESTLQADAFTPTGHRTREEGLFLLYWREHWSGRLTFPNHRLSCTLN